MEDKTQKDIEDGELSGSSSDDFEHENEGMLSLSDVSDKESEFPNYSSHIESELELEKDELVKQIKEMKDVKHLKNIKHFLKKNKNKKKMKKHKRKKKTKEKKPKKSKVISIAQQELAETISCSKSHVSTSTFLAAQEPQDAEEDRLFPTLNDVRAIKTKPQNDLRIIVPVDKSNRTNKVDKMIKVIEQCTDLTTHQMNIETQNKKLFTSKSPSSSKHGSIKFCETDSRNRSLCSEKSYDPRDRRYCPQDRITSPNNRYNHRDRSQSPSRRHSPRDRSTSSNCRYYPRHRSPIRMHTNNKYGSRERSRSPKYYARHKSPPRARRYNPQDRTSSPRRRRYHSRETSVSPGPRDRNVSLNKRYHSKNRSPSPMVSSKRTPSPSSCRAKSRRSKSGSAVSERRRKRLGTISISSGSRSSSASSGTREKNLVKCAINYQKCMEISSNNTSNIGTLPETNLVKFSESNTNVCDSTESTKHVVPHTLSTLESSPCVEAHVNNRNNGSIELDINKNSVVDRHKHCSADETIPCEQQHIPPNNLNIPITSIVPYKACVSEISDENVSNYDVVSMESISSLISQDKVNDIHLPIARSSFELEKNNLCSLNMYENLPLAPPLLRNDSNTIPILTSNRSEKDIFRADFFKNTTLQFANIPSSYEESPKMSRESSPQSTNENQIRSTCDRDVVVLKPESKDSLVILGFMANSSSEFFKELQDVLFAYKEGYQKTQGDIFTIQKWFVIINSIYDDLIHKNNNTTCLKVIPYVHLFSLILDYFKDCILKPKNIYTDDLHIYITKLEVLSVWLTQKMLDLKAQDLEDKDLAVFFRDNENNIFKFLYQKQFKHLERAKERVQTKIAIERLTKTIDGILNVRGDGPKYYKSIEQLSMVSWEYFFKRLSSDLQETDACKYLQKWKELFYEKNKIQMLKDHIAILKKSTHDEINVSPERGDRLIQLHRVLKSWDALYLLEQVEDILEVYESALYDRKLSEDNPHHGEMTPRVPAMPVVNSNIKHHSCPSNGDSINKEITCESNSPINDESLTVKSIRFMNEKSKETSFVDQCQDKFVELNSTNDIFQPEQTDEKHLLTQADYVERYTDKDYELINSFLCNARLKSPIPDIDWGKNLNCTINTNQSFFENKIEKQPSHLHLNKPLGEGNLCSRNKSLHTDQDQLLKNVISISKDPRLCKGVDISNRGDSTKTVKKEIKPFVSSIPYKLEMLSVEIPFVRYREKLANPYNTQDPRLKKDKGRLNEESGFPKNVEVSRKKFCAPKSVVLNHAVNELPQALSVVELGLRSSGLEQIDASCDKTKDPRLQKTQDPRLNKSKETLSESRNDLKSADCPSSDIQNKDVLLTATTDSVVLDANLNKSKDPRLQKSAKRSSYTSSIKTKDPRLLKKRLNPETNALIDVTQKTLFKDSCAWSRIPFRGSCAESSGKRIPLTTPIPIQKSVVDKSGNNNIHSRTINDSPELFLKGGKRRSSLGVINCPSRLVSHIKPPESDENTPTAAIVKRKVDPIYDQLDKKMDSRDCIRGQNGTEDKVLLDSAFEDKQVGINNSESKTKITLEKSKCTVGNKDKRLGSNNGKEFADRKVQAQISDKRSSIHTLKTLNKINSQKLSNIIAKNDSTDVKKIKVNTKNSSSLKPNLKCIDLFKETTPNKLRHVLSSMSIKGKDSTSTVRKYDISKTFPKSTDRNKHSDGALPQNSKIQSFDSLKVKSNIKLSSCKVKKITTPDKKTCIAKISSTGNTSAFEGSTKCNKSFKHFLMKTPYLKAYRNDQKLFECYVVIENKAPKNSTERASKRSFDCFILTDERKVSSEQDEVISKKKRIDEKTLTTLNTKDNPQNNIKLTKTPEHCIIKQTKAWSIESNGKHKIDLNEKGINVKNRSTKDKNGGKKKSLDDKTENVNKKDKASTKLMFKKEANPLIYKMMKEKCSSNKEASSPEAKTKNEVEVASTETNVIEKLCSMENKNNELCLTETNIEKEVSALKSSSNNEISSLETSSKKQRSGNICKKDACSTNTGENKELGSLSNAQRLEKFDEATVNNICDCKIFKLYPTVTANHTVVSSPSETSINREKCFTITEYNEKSSTQFTEKTLTLTEEINELYSIEPRTRKKKLVTDIEEKISLTKNEETKEANACDVQSNERIVKTNNGFEMGSNDSQTNALQDVNLKQCMGEKTETRSNQYPNEVQTLNTLNEVSVCENVATAGDKQIKIETKLKFANNQIDLKSVWSRMKRHALSVKSECERKPIPKLPTGFVRNIAVAFPPESERSEPVDNQIPEVFVGKRFSLDSNIVNHKRKLPIKLHLRRCSDDTWMAQKSIINTAHKESNSLVVTGHEIRQETESPPQRKALTELFSCSSDGLDNEVYEDSGHSSSEDVESSSSILSEMRHHKSSLKSRKRKSVLLNEHDHQSPKYQVSSNLDINQLLHSINIVSTEKIDDPNDFIHTETKEQVENSDVSPKFKKQKRSKSKFGKFNIENFILPNKKKVL